MKEVGNSGGRDGEGWPLWNESLSKESCIDGITRRCSQLRQWPKYGRSSVVSSERGQDKNGGVLSTFATSSNNELGQ